MDVSPDGKLAVTGSNDTNLRLWNLENGECIDKFVGHFYGISAICFMPGGEYIVSGDYSGNIKVWSVSKGENINIIRTGENPITGLFPYKESIIAIDRDKHLREWDFAAGKCHRIYDKSIDDIVRTIHLDIATSIFANEGENRLCVYDILTGKIKNIVGTTEIGFSPVSISSDKKFGISGDKNGVCYWDLPTGRCLRTIAQSADNAVISPCGNIGVSTDRNFIYLWNLSAGIKVPYFPALPRRIKYKNQTKVTIEDLIRELEKSLKIGSTHDIANIVTRIRSLPEYQHSQIAKELCYKAGKVGKKTFLISANFYKEIRSPKNSTVHIAISADGETIFSSGQEKTFQIWNLYSGIYEVPSGIDTHVSMLSTSSNGKLCAIYDGWGYLHIWDLLQKIERKTFPTRDSKITAITLSPDNKYCLTGNQEGDIKTWDLLTGTCIRSFKLIEVDIHAIAVSPDGSQILIGSSTNKIDLWNLLYGNYIRSYSIHPIREMPKYGTYSVNSLNFSTDGRYFLSGSSDSTVCLCELFSGKVLWVYKGHTDSVTKVSFSSDRKVALSVSDDSTMRLLDTQTGECIRIFGSETKPYQRYPKIKAWHPHIRRNIS